MNAPAHAVAPMSTVAPVARAMATGSANSDGRSPASSSRAGVDRERPLIVRQCRPIRVDQAVAVEHHDGRGGSARVHPLRDELALQKGGDADRRPTGADEHEAVGGEAPRSRRAASRPARTTAPVPWMSSLKLGSRCR